MNCSPFSVLSGPFVRHYSIFNDGILNSVMMHVLDKDFNIVINPCTLTKIPGGFMDHIKLAAQILSIVNSIQTYENVSSFEPAEKAFINQFQSQFSGSFTSSPLAIFSSCKLSSVDFDSKCIHLKFENSLCGIVCWWILLQKKAGEFLVEHYGMMYPATHFSAHAVSESIKCTATSKTMCTEEVVTFANKICPVGRALSDVLKTMKMKLIKIMPWCAKRMASLFCASLKTVKLVLHLHDVLVSCDIKAEERDYFMYV